MDSRQTEGELGLATGPGMTTQYVPFWPPPSYYPPRPSLPHPLCLPLTSLSRSPASPPPGSLPHTRFVDGSVGSVNVVTRSLRGEVYTWPTAAHLLTRQPGHEALLQSVVLPVPAPAAPFIPTIADTLDPLPGRPSQPPGQGQGQGPDGPHGNSAVGLGLGLVFSRPPSGLLPPAEPLTTTTTTTSAGAAAAGISRPPSTLSRKFESSGALSRGGAGNLRCVNALVVGITPSCDGARLIPLPVVAPGRHCSLRPDTVVCSPPGRPLPP